MKGRPDLFSTASFLTKTDSPHSSNAPYVQGPLSQEEGTHRPRPGRESGIREQAALGMCLYLGRLLALHPPPGMFPMTKQSAAGGLLHLQADVPLSRHHPKSLSTLPNRPRLEVGRGWSLETRCSGASG